MYRLNIIACHKPWRGSQTLYTSNSSVFNLFYEDSMLEDVELPEDQDIWDFLEENFTSKISYPITIQAETTQSILNKRLDIKPQIRYNLKMNLFILDTDLDLNAQYHVDKHVVKMILEASQLLCSAYWITRAIGPTPRKLTPLELAECKRIVTPEFYGLTHYNHPCAVWTRTSQDNFEYTFCYAQALNDEYGYRYGKSHKSVQAINKLDVDLPRGPTPFAQAMPDQYKHDDAVVAYRAYYAAEKAHIFAWKNRPRPYWLESPSTNPS